MTTLTVLSSDGSYDVGTITKTEYDAARAEADQVHVVLPQPRGGE